MGAETLGLILAGGASRRFGADKRLAELNGQSLLALVAARAALQVDRLAINAASDPSDLNLPLIPDSTPGEGPLAGLLAGLAWAQAQNFAYIAIFPCDTPFFPSDVVARLRQALSDGADFAMARCCDEIQSTFALVRVSRRDRIEEAFQGGLRSLRGLGSVLRCAFADFSDRDGPNGDCFFNINQPSDLDLAAAWLKS